VQEFELSQFLEENKWVSDAVITGSGADISANQIYVDISSDGHDLIRDNGMQEFEQRIQARLSSLSLKKDCWKIRPVTPEIWGRSVPGLEHNFPPVLSRVDHLPYQRLLLDISSDLGWFRGHFPGNPVLAGVVQLHWAVSVSLALFKFSEVPVEIKRLKFKSIVIPPTILELALSKPGESEVQFEFSSLGQVHSLGRLIF
jgi:hypothetical protein